MMTPKPIATAPRGRRILAWLYNIRNKSGMWITYVWPSRYDYPIVPDRHCDLWSGSDDLEITHWDYLPPAPQEAQNQC